MDEISPFRQYLIGALRDRRHNVSLIYRAPLSYYAIARGIKEPTYNDLVDIANYLQVAAPFVMGLYTASHVAENDVAIGSEDFQEIVLRAQDAALNSVSKFNNAGG